PVNVETIGHRDSQETSSLRSAGFEGRWLACRPDSTRPTEAGAMAHDHDLDGVEEHDRGLSHDLPTLLSRRRALALLGGAGLAAAPPGGGGAGGGGDARRRRPHAR